MSILPHAIRPALHAGRTEKLIEWEDFYAIGRTEIGIGCEHRSGGISLMGAVRRFGRATVG
jgi:hypothetical protein